MGHRLDFVDLQKPKVRGPPMCLEQRIMIRTEMSRRAPPMNGGVHNWKKTARQTVLAGFSGNHERQAERSPVVHRDVEIILMLAMDESPARCAFHEP